MKRMILALALIAPAAHAQEMTADALPYAAMCAYQMNEPAIWDAAFSAYADQNPDGLTQGELSEVEGLEATAEDMEEISGNPAAEAWLQSICEAMKAEFIPG